MIYVFFSDCVQRTLRFAVCKQLKVRIVGVASHDISSCYHTAMGTTVKEVKLCLLGVGIYVY